MSASFAYTEADVTVTGLPPDPDADAARHLRHTVMVRNGVARVRARNGNLVRERGGILTVEKRGRGAWLVTFVDGEVWQVDAVGKRCGACGG